MEILTGLVFPIIISVVGIVVGAIVGFGIGIVAAALMWWLFTSNLLEGLFEA